MKKKSLLRSGFKLWLKANKVIPGGNSILSKRPERYAGKLCQLTLKNQKDVKFGI